MAFHIDLPWAYQDEEEANEYNTNAHASKTQNSSKNKNNEIVIERPHKQNMKKKHNKAAETEKRKNPLPFRNQSYAGFPFGGAFQIRDILAENRLAVHRSCSTPGRLEILACEFAQEIPETFYESAEHGSGLKK